MGLADISSPSLPQSVKAARDRLLGSVTLPATDNTSPLLRTKEAAARVGLAEATLEKLRCLGGGPPYFKVSRKRVVYDAAELDLWARSQRFASTSDVGSPRS
ncbi:Predicted DNA-binding transcriptional regulator AlpA [Methylocapsa palsarum]|uniref:Predicted DNA-binding transcriptional regulator AlpA n=1 Tax=Methylocapsa palsarum TaxID=1612308 RepID=A0A1I3W997_9HYPH|nr:Predicted DNA-binding transcriptional regulator AlpA [Methylocapsa palsarum]